MTVWEFSWLTLMTELEVQFRSSERPIENDIFQLLVSDEGQNHLPRLPHTPKMYFIITLKELCVQLVFLAT